jgi:MFS family permease
MAVGTEPVTAPAEEPTAQAPSLWHDREFVKLWVGETVSMFGTQVTTLALPLTALLVLGISGDELGLIRFLQGVAFVILPIPLGVWVDRRRHRPVLVGTNLVRAALVGSVPVLASLDMLRLPTVYLVALGAGVCWVVFDVTWLSYIPAVVRDRRQLVEANGKLGVSFASAQVAGPGLAGLLVQLLSAPFALLFDAVSYLVSAVSLLSIRRREPEPVPTARDSSMRENLVAGVRWVFGHPQLRVVVMIGTFHNFFTIWIQPVFLLFAVQTLDLGPGLIGFVLSVSAVGGIVGSAAASRLLQRRAFGHVYVTAVVAMLVSRFLLPAAAGPTAVAVAIAVVSFAVTNATMAAANVLGISLRQTVTPKPLMARMNAVMRTMTFGLASSGALAGGWVADQVGPRTALWWAAAGSVVTVLPLCFSSIRHLRSLADATDGQHL